MTANSQNHHNNVQIPRLHLPRNRASAPLHRITVDLLKTYCNINQRYYHQLQSTRVLYNDGYDDEKGDYVINLGEKLQDRYQVKSHLGKGSYGQVFEAYDHVNQELVAVKIIKNKVPFYNQGLVEVRVLEKINQLDPDDSHGIVRLKDKFVHRNHLCLVFELLSVNLFELLKKTQFKGVSLTLIRKFGHQILTALYFQAQADVIHCDLKPENILIKSPSSSTIKVIDYGSSCFVNERIFPYIQSRFYRAPEVILESGYSLPIDIWSLGCILMEMHTGQPLFNGQNEQELLARFIQLLGTPPVSMISTPKANKFFRFHSDGSCSFRKCDIDTQDVQSLEEILGINTGGPGRRRMGERGHSPEDYHLFKDLIEKMISYLPSTRITPIQALHHPFFRPQSIVSSPSIFIPTLQNNPSMIGSHSSNNSSDKDHQMVTLPPLSLIQTSSTSFLGSDPFTKKTTQESSSLLMYSLRHTNNNSNNLDRSHSLPGFSPHSFSTTREKSGYRGSGSQQTLGSSRSGQKICHYSPYQ
eukprot:TRINITY_DN17827_c0_g1_i1.p1 TRINITY_DN17827_c0_g1~~TRINITY_DN17827_c0_g1_i1.p1  ORF type:complete len:543 (+),score=90.49 TRINITY_DN17827_c0_g1_i1:49-1629(+)